MISLEEGVGKMKAALDGRGDPTLVIMARTGAASITSLDDAIARAKAYEATGVDALFFTGIKTRAELEAIAAATTLPIVLGGAPEEMTTLDYLGGQRVRIALQGHAPFAAATQAVYETLKALRDGTSPRDLKGLASSGIDRPRHARSGRESAQRRISRAQEIDERRDPPGDDPGPGAGRRLSRLGRASGERRAISKAGCATAATAASRRCLQDLRTLSPT